MGLKKNEPSVHAEESRAMVRGPLSLACVLTMQTSQEKKIKQIQPFLLASCKETLRVRGGK
jgi:hypothetical protein